MIEYFEEEGGNFHRKIFDCIVQTIVSPVIEQNALNSYDCFLYDSTCMKKEKKIYTCRAVSITSRVIGNRIKLR